MSVHTRGVYATCVQVAVRIRQGHQIHGHRGLQVAVGCLLRGLGLELSSARTMSTFNHLVGLQPHSLVCFEIGSLRAKLGLELPILVPLPPKFTKAGQAQV